MKRLGEGRLEYDEGEWKAEEENELHERRVLGLLVSAVNGSGDDDGRKDIERERMMLKGQSLGFKRFGVAPPPQRTICTALTDWDSMERHLESCSFKLRLNLQRRTSNQTPVAVNF
ncbi:hypothetical protein TWF694_010757 [Orbilia ellipsospora]|uniref:Uncharacterized protein n=1 Tax=Orbilia ellipsospora TaxID=2528407 RepID=A0AAV9X6Y3_9PEZI